MKNANYTAAVRLPNALAYRNLAMYIGAGSIGTVAHFLILFGTSASFGPVVASSIGAIIGCIINYCLAREIVFHSTTSRNRSLPRFAVVASTGVLVNALVIGMLAPLLPIALSQVMASGTVLLFGYAANKNWTFNDY